MTTASDEVTPAPTTVKPLTAKQFYVAPNGQRFGIFSTEDADWIADVRNQEDADLLSSAPNLYERLEKVAQFLRFKAGMFAAMGDGQSAFSFGWEADAAFATLNCARSGK